jgi:acetyl-CoA carboxylase biotin carboxyl carrier protein
MTGSSDDGNRKLELADLTAILDLLKASEWRSARLRMGDFELELSDGMATSGFAPAPAPAAPATASTAPATTKDAAAEPGTVDGVVVRAQTLGVFWRSPQPGAAPFVEVGDIVAADSPLGIVEVMKMMTRIEPGIAGRVVAIHVENGDVVEFDQPLVTIAPE